MRYLILFLLLPVLTNAQAQRSAEELARESISSFVQTKAFKGQGYQPMSYGTLRLLPKSDPDEKDSWELTHAFRTTVKERGDRGGLVERSTTWKMIFHLDYKMNVFRAEAASFLSWDR